MPEGQGICTEEIAAAVAGKAEGNGENLMNCLSNAFSENQSFSRREKNAFIAWMGNMFTKGWEGLKQAFASEPAEEFNYDAQTCENDVTALGTLAESIKPSFCATLAESVNGIYNKVINPEEEQLQIDINEGIGKGAIIGIAAAGALIVVGGSVAAAYSVYKAKHKDGQNIGPETGVVADIENPYKDYDDLIELSTEEEWSRSSHSAMEETTEPEVQLNNQIQFSKNAEETEEKEEISEKDLKAETQSQKSNKSKKTEPVTIVLGEAPVGSVQPLVI